jgi:Ser/Thr protein kinase RdoA (MazF antagonist)
MFGVEAALEALGLSATSVRVLTDQRNAHWLVATPDGYLILRRFGRVRSVEEARYEARVIEFLSVRGWPVARPVADPQEIDGHVWSAFEYLIGEPPEATSATRRETGRLIARLQQDLADLVSLGQRPGWIRRDEILSLDPPMEEVLSRCARELPEEIPILIRCAERARARIEELDVDRALRSIVHGDIVPWNLLYTGGVLSGILDFEFAHFDLRVVEFSHSWRGQYLEVIEGFEEITPLDENERALIAPLYWLWLLEFARTSILAGEVPDLSWTMPHIMRESNLTMF